MATMNPTQSPFEPASTPFPPAVVPNRPAPRDEDPDAEARPAASVVPVVVSIVALFGLAVVVAFAGRGVLEMLAGVATG